MPWCLKIDINKDYIQLAARSEIEIVSERGDMLICKPVGSDNHFSIKNTNAEWVEPKEDPPRGIDVDQLAPALHDYKKLVENEIIPIEIPQTQPEAATGGNHLPVVPKDQQPVTKQQINKVPTKKAAKKTAIPTGGNNTLF